MFRMVSPVCWLPLMKRLDFERPYERGPERNRMSQNDSPKQVQLDASRSMRGSAADLLQDLEAGYVLAVKLAEKERGELTAPCDHDLIAVGFGMALRRVQNFIQHHGQ